MNQRSLYKDPNYAYDCAVIEDRVFTLCATNKTLRKKIAKINFKLSALEQFIHSRPCPESQLLAHASAELKRIQQAVRHEN